MVVKEPKEPGKKKAGVVTDHDTGTKSLQNDLETMIKESLDQLPEGLKNM